MSKELEDYKKAVEYYASEKKNYLLYNKGGDHAKIVLENIFTNANDIVRIAAASLCNEVADDDSYISSISKFLRQKNTKLFIFLSDSQFDLNEKKDERFWKTIIESKAYFEDRVTIKKARDDHFFTISYAGNNDKPVHFTTADGRMYRLEYDIESRSARCNFNDEKYTSELDTVFDKAFQDGLVVALWD